MAQGGLLPAQPQQDKNLCHLPQPSSPSNEQRGECGRGECQPRMDHAKQHLRTGLQSSQNEEEQVPSTLSPHSGYLWLQP